MRTPNSTLSLAAFGLNVVDDYAPDYAGWSIPPLQACCNDAAGFAALAAMSGLSATTFVSTYVGQLSSVVPVGPVPSPGSAPGRGTQQEKTERTEKPTSAPGQGTRPTMEFVNLPPYRLALDCTREMVRAQIAGRAGYVKPGELTVICISGHGTQEVYPLETVESLVLSDGLMADFEFHNLLALFPAGSRVAVFLDTCHSGGMERAAGFRFRPKFTAPIPRVDEDGRALKELKPKNAIKANIAVFAACPKEQTALDGLHNGAFTGSYLRAAQEAIEAKERPNWMDVFHRAAQFCYSQFHQQPVVTFYGDASVWNQPFFK